jgi:hypothetical protein
MADTSRHPFGGGIADYVFAAGGGGVVTVAGGATLQFFNAQTGGSAYTDLAEDAGGATPLSTVTSYTGSSPGTAAGDIPVFYGPPGIRWMWASADGGPRKLMFANDLAEAVQAAVSASLVTNKGDLLAGLNAGELGRLGIGSTGQVLTADPTQTLGMRWAAPSGGGGGGGSSLTGVVWVAAADAPAAFADAEYHCDGVADEVTIQAALAAADGMPVHLSPGEFTLAGPVVLAGVNDVDAETTRILRGSGTYTTILTVAPGALAGITFADAVCPHVSDLTIYIEGASHGIYATKPAALGAGQRSFWHGSIRDVAIKGPWDGSHTGWAMSLGSGFRFTVDNIEIAGVLNGIRVVNESASFNCGDATFNRIFAEIIGNNGTAYHVSSPTGNANQLLFTTCFGIAQEADTGTTMWKFDGAGATSHVRVINSNAEQFKTSVAIAATAYDIKVDIVHATQNGGTFAQVAGYSCHVSGGLVYVPAGVISAITETNGYDAKPNTYELDIYADTGSTVNATLLTGAILRGVSDGPGIVAGVLKQKPGRGFLVTFTKAGAIGAAPQTGTFRIYNDSGNDRVLRSARATLGTVYTTGSTLVDINLNGASIFSAPANRPTIAANTNTSGRATTGVQGVIWPAGAYMTVDIDQVGSAGTGADMTVQIDTYN